MSIEPFAAEPWKPDHHAERRGSAPACTACVCSVSGTRSRVESIQLSSASTMKLSMIVVITSCAPHFARSAPGTNPTAPPAHIAAIVQSGTATSADVPAGSASPTSAAASPPAASCPSAPMLNRPARSPTATARPVQMSVVVL